MILGADGKRLSKRHGAVSVLAYREAGYLPSALLNYLARLGWSHGDQEVCSRDEMTQLFSLAKRSANSCVIIAAPALETQYSPRSGLAIVALTEVTKLMER